jgi:hypothetical protein
MNIPLAFKKTPPSLREEIAPALPAERSREANESVPLNYEEGLWNPATGPDGRLLFS